MAKIKVLDLASEVGMENDKLLVKLRRMGVKVKDKKAPEPEKMVSSSDEKIIERDSEKEIIEKRVKPTVIRRRTRTLETKVEAPTPLPPPPLPIIKPVVLEAKPSTTIEKAEPARVALEGIVEKPVLRKEGKSARPKKGKEKIEGEAEAVVQVEVKVEEKVLIPPAAVEEKGNGED